LMDSRGAFEGRPQGVRHGGGWERDGTGAGAARRPLRTPAVPGDVVPRHAGKTRAGDALPGQVGASGDETQIPGCRRKQRWSEIETFAACFVTVSDRGYSRT